MNFIRIEQWVSEPRTEMIDVFIDEASNGLFFGHVFHLPWNPEHFLKYNEPAVGLYTEIDTIKAKSKNEVVEEAKKRLKELFPKAFSEESEILKKYTN